MVSRGNVGFQEIKVIAMKLLWLLFSEGMHADIILLNGPSIEVKGEEESDLITLQTFISAVKFPIVFEQVDVELQTAA